MKMMIHILIAASFAFGFSSAQAAVDFATCKKKYEECKQDPKYMFNKKRCKKKRKSCEARVAAVLKKENAKKNRKKSLLSRSRGEGEIDKNGQSLRDKKRAAKRRAMLNKKKKKRKLNN